MPANIEIKARVVDMQALRRRAAALCDQAPVIIEQLDTFFNIPRGRLKLRTWGTGAGQLIYYERLDERGPKRSDYFVADLAEANGVEEVLSKAYGVRRSVRKRRELFLIRNTRVHLDTVDDLGEFVELEVVLGPGESDRGGEAEARRLMASLGIADADCVTGAYVDLLEELAS